MENQKQPLDQHWKIELVPLLLEYITKHSTQSKSSIEFIQKQRMGLTDKGVKQLLALGEELGTISYTSFDEECYIMNDFKKWIKKVTFADGSSYYDIKTDLSLVLHNEYILFHQTKQNDAPKEILSQQPIAKFHVDRTQISLGSYTIDLDSLCFPEEDPYFVCSVAFYAHTRPIVTPPSLLDIVKETSIVPVRSKMLEFLFRYNKALYQQVEREETPYYQCMLQSQMAVLYAKSSFDKIFKIEDRMYGRPNPTIYNEEFLQQMIPEKRDED